jgi:hypothetical protein
LVLTLIGAGVGAIGVIIGVGLDGQNPDKFELELTKALLTLGTGLILGGAVKVVLDQLQNAQRVRAEDQARRATQLAEEQARHERLLGDLRHVHDRAENVRLMVAAQRSAKTYGDHMRALIGCQVVLLKVKRTLDVSRPGGASQATDDHLKQMVGYLRALQYEFRDHYKTVSDLQRYDEDVTKEAFQRAAKREVTDGAAGDTPAPESSQRAWTLLASREQFPVLDDLTNNGPCYRKHFLEPLHALAAALVETEGDRGDPGAADTEFDRGVETLAGVIGSTCEGSLAAT